MSTGLYSVAKIELSKSRDVVLTTWLLWQKICSNVKI